MNRTKVALDDALVKKRQAATGIKRRKRQRKMLQLRGGIKWAGDLDAWRR
jgi:hypothetical protein